jgi:glucose/arabinose dehydrogenase
MNKTKKLKIIIIVASFLLLLVLFAIRFYLSRSPKISFSTQFSPEKDEEGIKNTEVIAENLNIPWEIAFLPDGEILVTERPGFLRLIKIGQRIPVEKVEHVGEGGLLGLAIHPQFSENRWIYLYLTTKDFQGLDNIVVRYRLEDNKLLNPRIILQGVKGNSNHNGGRIAFGPDGYLYITTGDAQNPSLSQDVNSLNGKILRIKDDGAIPPDNPFGNEVYSFGHRNPQGLAWDDKGNLWATEHGRSGIRSGLDELNLIEKGKNYGWPIIQGEQKNKDMVTPIIQSGETVTWAPAGAIYYQGSIFFAGLRGKALFEYDIVEKSLKKHFEGRFGRIRAVAIGPDGYFYMATSNTDGRGNPESTDDRLVRIDPRIFN